jgi:hypothetical protein
MSGAPMHLSASWAFNVQDSIGEIVEKRFPQEAHRWPLLRNFNFEAYLWREKYLIVILREKLSGVPAGPARAEPLDDPDAPQEIPSTDNFVTWQAFLRSRFTVRPRDFVMIVPVASAESDRVEKQWEHFSEEEKTLWRYQIDFNLTRQFYYLKGFDMTGDFFLPPGYQFLADICTKFFADHPNYQRNVFIMTRLVPGNRLLEELDSQLRDVLRGHGLNPVRADVKMYMPDRNLWNNVCVYMICCKYGIAILEDRIADEFNPNVALEYGFMRALNKPALFLADTGFRNLRADMVGTLREAFDITDIRGTIRQPVETWLRELELIPS